MEIVGIFRSLHPLWFLDHISLLVPVGVHSMRREFGGNEVNSIFQVFLNTVQLFGKHLVSFGHVLELVVEILDEIADMLSKVLIEVFSELSKFCVEISFKLSKYRINFSHVRIPRYRRFS